MGSHDLQGKEATVTAPFARKYGWKADTDDPRDKRMKLAPHQKVLPLPTRFSLRSKMPPVYNQDILGSCTNQAVGALFHYRELTDDNPRLVTPSVLFGYYNTRRLEGTVREDSGAEIRNAIKSAATWGLCEDVLWPYKIGKFAVRPPAKAYKQAKLYKAVNYWRVPQDPFALKYSLFADSPVVYGQAWYENFEAPEVLGSGVLPSASGRVLGGHAILLTGWDDDKRCFEFRNSYGEEWGDGGYGWVDYDFLTNPEQCSDFWTFAAIP